MPSFDCELSLAILKVDLDYDSKETEEITPCLITKAT